MRSKFLLSIIGSALLLSGCFNAEEEKAKIKNDIQPFYESFLFEDIDVTMDYFTLNSDTYFEMYQTYLESFNLYNLLYVPEGITFDSIEKDVVHAKVKLHITGTGPEKEKIDRTVVHILEYRMNAEGIWKIYSLVETPYN